MVEHFIIIIQYKIYAGKKEMSTLVFLSNGTRIYLNKFIGDLDEDAVKRFQIRKTIEEHLIRKLC